MITKENIVQTLKLLNKKYQNLGFKVNSLFGSYARGTNDSFSDIDLTYTINHNKFYKDDAFGKLAKIEDIKIELQNQFHTKVDLIPANTKNKYIQNSLQQEQVLI